MGTHAMTAAASSAKGPAPSPASRDQSSAAEKPLECSFTIWSEYDPHARAWHVLSEEMVSQLVAKTDGIPLFVEEMTHMVLDRATTDDAPPSFGTLRSIPVTLHGLLLARLDMLHVMPR